MEVTISLTYLQWKRTKSVSFKDAPWWRSKIINVIKSLPLSHVFLMFRVTKWYVCIKPFFCVPNGCLEEKHLWNWVMSWISPILSTGHHFTWKKTRRKNWLFRFGRHILKKKKQMKWVCCFKKKNPSNNNIWSF